MVFKTAIYVSKGTFWGEICFWEKNVFEKKYVFEKTDKDWKKFKHMSGVFKRSCENSSLRVQWYILSGNKFFEKFLIFLSFLVIERNTFDCSSKCIWIGLSNWLFTCPEKHLEENFFWILCNFFHFWRFREKFPAFSKKLSVSVVIYPF